MGTIIRKNMSYEKRDKLKEKLKQKNTGQASRKLYQLFLGELDEISKEQLTRLDHIVHEYCDEFMCNGGWAVGKKDIISHDSRQVAPDYITFRLVRDLEGFHQQPNVPEGIDVSTSRLTEERFLEEKKVQLDILHHALLMRDDITHNRKYKVSNPEREAFVEELRELLGYNDPNITILPPSKTDTPVEGPKVTM